MSDVMVEKIGRLFGIWLHDGRIQNEGGACCLDQQELDALWVALGEHVSEARREAESVRRLEAMNCKVTAALARDRAELRAGLSAVGGGVSDPVRNDTGTVTRDEDLRITSDALTGMTEAGRAAWVDKMRE